VLRGTTGRDSLVAGDGDDTVIGNWGRDTIDGGAGDDLLAGGLGSDVFVFSPNFGNDTVRDFSTERTWFSNHDILDLRALGVTAANFESLVSIEQQGGNVLIAVRDQGTIVLQDKSTEAFDTSHILIG
jgi:Ca2+-binding RTX toxin-like protein